MPKQIAQWNPARDVWETPTMGLFCEHSDVYSETWPSSGMTRGGTAYEQPTSARLMAGSASSCSLPTPRATRDGSATETVNLLPTPTVNDMGEGKTVEHWDKWTATMQARHGNGNGHGKSLAIEAQRLLPTPTTQPTTGNGHARNLGKEIALLPTPKATNNENWQDAAAGYGPNLGGARTLWGPYAPAIARWECVLGRPAPAPTEAGRKGGGQRLRPRFVEWMMGLPAGHVTDVAISRNDQLKALGNGVVPQQAAEATRRFLLDALEAAA